MLEFAYDDIIVFSKVVRLGSFSAAAKILNLSQSTISRRISALEKKLGVKLLRRNTQKIELTDIGELIYERTQIRHQQFEEDLESILQQKSILRGTLKISLPLSFGEIFISPSLPEFIKTYPDINLTLIYQNCELDLIQDGFDAAIINHIPRFPDQKIKLLYTAEIGVYCTPEYIHRHGEIKNLVDMGQHLFMIGIDFSGKAIHNVEIKNKDTNEVVVFEVPIKYATNHAEQSKFMVYSHEMLAIGCSFMFEKDVAEGKLVRVLPNYSMEPTKFYLIRHQKEDSAKVSVFFDYISKLFQPS